MLSISFGQDNQSQKNEIRKTGTDDVPVDEGRAYSKLTGNADFGKVHVSMNDTGSSVTNEQNDTQDAFSKFLEMAYLDKKSLVSV
jgi:hypothetical protein